MRDFQFRKAQHPDGGLLLSMTIHCDPDEMDVIERFCGLADVLAPQVEPGPDQSTSEAGSGPQFYNAHGAANGEGQSEIPRRRTGRGTEKR